MAVLVGGRVGVGVAVAVDVAVGVAVTRSRILKLSVLQSWFTYSWPVRHSHALYSPPLFGVVKYGDGKTRSQSEVGPNVPTPPAITTTAIPSPRIVFPDGSVTATS